MKYLKILTIRVNYLWFVLALVFNSEQQAVYYCEDNDVEMGACIIIDNIYLRTLDMKRVPFTKDS